MSFRVSKHSDSVKKLPTFSSFCLYEAFFHQNSKHCHHIMKVARLMIVRLLFLKLTYNEGMGVLWRFSLQTYFRGKLAIIALIEGYYQRRYMVFFRTFLHDTSRKKPYCMRSATEKKVSWGKVFNQVLPRPLIRPW